jgi:hypothetical protein
LKIAAIALTLSKKEERFDAEGRALVLFITERDLRRDPFMAENAMLAVPLFSMC